MIRDRTAGARRPTRRDVLATLGASGALALSGCLGGDDDEGGEATPTPNEDTVRIGVSIPEGGLWSNEGEQLLAGYRLATQHINEGTGAVTAGPWDALGDGGVLGNELELVVEDTRSRADGARESAETLADEGVDVLTGGGSAAEGIAHQEVADERELVYMGGFTPTGAVGGTSCSRYGFNEIFTPPMVAEALASVLADEVGTDADVNFAQLYPDTDVGAELSRTFRSRLQDIGDGWFHQYRDSTREGIQNFTTPVEELLARGPDLVVLNYYGFEADRTIRELLTQLEASEEHSVEDVEIVVPILNWVFARTAGSALAGVYGAVHWDARLEDSFSSRLVETWGDVDADSEVPPPATHLAYVQLCQYAAAAERAGTLEPSGVVPELEGYQYDVGAGQETLRECDHQAMRNVFVARGLPEDQQSAGRYYELLETWDGEAYSCDEPPAANCAMDEL
jgi:ABC-type branched-subunit amino acid transport system substrate-binding protein